MALERRDPLVVRRLRIIAIARERGGRQRLRAGLQDIAARYPDALSFERESVLSSLGAHLNTRASFAITRTFLSELKNASVTGKLAGNTPQERLRDYLRQLATPEYALPFLENYCVLARLVALITDQWVAASLEMLERLAHDWPAIRATFALAEPGEVSAVRAGLGDSHRGGRSVMCLTLRSGQKIVYKPRSLAIEQHFQEFLTWLNEQGVEPALRTFPVIDRGDIRTGYSGNVLIRRDFLKKAGVAPPQAIDARLADAGGLGAGGDVAGRREVVEERRALPAGNISLRYFPNLHATRHAAADGLVRHALSPTQTGRRTPRCPTRPRSLPAPTRNSQRSRYVPYERDDVKEK